MRVRLLTPANVLYQRAVLNGCSSLVYHIELTIIKHGSIPASRTPRMNLTAAKPAKLWQAAIQHSTPPQENKHRAIYFPIGTFVRSQSTGNSANR